MDSKTIFGIPYYVGKINGNSYNKKELIENIACNYNLDNSRNSWDSSSAVSSNLHHAYSDWENDKFKKLDLSQVSKLYESHIRTFLETLNFNSSYSFKYIIANYTCYGKNQFMLEHDHLQCDFSGVHYIKFDKLIHPPTVYSNPLIWNSYSSMILSNKFRETQDTVYNSWLRSNYHFGADEDDFVITPGALKHQVPLSKSEELRMALVVNIGIID